MNQRADDLEARVRALERVLESERATRADAERSSRLRGEVLATFAHELRNPLNAILGWATILNRRDDMPDPVRQAVQAIERNSRLQAKMIADLLDCAAISEGKVRLVTETIDPYPVVRAALQGVEATARAALVSVEASFDEESIRVEADAARLQQIVANVLSNAVKFSERGGVVRLTAGRTAESFRLMVSDRGKGIEPQLLPHIFDRFSHPDLSAGRSHGGLGFGLVIVKQLTDLHRGNVRAESAGKGLGATFTLELPLSPPVPVPA